ncbi:MAG: phosphoglycolate phosphatase [Usitatibacter sp.]
MNLTNSIRAVIFDLDGTLVESASEISIALERTFRDFGLAPPGQKQVEAMIGKGVRVLVERALARAGADGVDLDAVVEKFEAHYAQTVGTAAALYPGVMDGLNRLRAAGVPMAVVTNKPRFFTLQLLDRVGVSGLFAAVVAGDDGLTRKPAGDMLVAACRQMGHEPGDTLMIGDSDNDITAARNAGCPVWCVPYGYNEGKRPEALACDRLVATIDTAARLI